MYGMDEFLTIDNFRLAFKRLQTVSYDYYKELYKPDLINYGLNLDENIMFTISNIEKGIYLPKSVNKLYIPKPNGLIRPITVLDFQDLLIYQALINIIAEAFYSDFQNYYNVNVFGNVYNKANNKKQEIFFYVKWQEQWGKFLNQTKYLVDEGYVHLSEFDMASFYDTIDHRVLAEFLLERIDLKVIDFLIKLLVDWTVDSERLNKKISHGIPQGPLASGFLSEIYLKYIDSEFIDRIGDTKIKYIRYADDIRLFAKESTVAKRYLVYLDLFARDIGLIPQSGKIQTKKIESQEALIDILEKTSQSLPIDFEQRYSSNSASKDNIAEIANNYKVNGQLNEDEENYLLNLVFKTIEEDKPDKTILRFSLYRIGPSEQLRDKLIENYDKLLFIFEDLCIYLSKYFLKGKVVNKWVYSLLEDKHIVYHYPIALIFKYFMNVIEYRQEFFEKFYISNKTKHWYIKYFMLDWLCIKKPFLILSLEKGKEDNIRIEKKLLAIKYNLTRDKEDKIVVLRYMLCSEHDEIALQGLFLYITETSMESISNLFDKIILINPFIYSLISSIENETGSIHNILTTIGIEGKGIFNKINWSKIEFKKLTKMVILTNSLKELDPSLWLNSIDRLNYFLLSKYYDSIKDMKLDGFGDAGYEHILKDGTILDTLPLVVKNFTTIHEKKKDLETGNVKFSFYDIEYFLSIEKNALRQIAAKSNTMVEDLQYSTYNNTVNRYSEQI